ncbi:unnamed protein product [Camellia sinensis]
MLATSKWFKQVSQCKPKSYISSIEQKACLNYQIHRLIGEKVNGKRTWWFDKHVNGCLLTSSHALRRRRYYQHTNFITCILVGVSWIWPSFATVNNSIGNYQSLATQASPSEEELTDEFLNQIMSAIENAPISTREICTTYIEKLCRDGNLAVATRLLKSLRDKHIFLSAYAYNLLLIAAGEGSDIALLSQVFRDLLLTSESVSSTSYLNLAKAFMNINDVVLLLGLIKEVSELTFPRSATVTNRIIFAFAECRQSDKALLIFDHMKSLKCKPDLITYNTVLGILGRVGRADEMLFEFASMKEANVIPDIISYNTLINSLRKLGRLDMCLVFLKEMEERGLEPDLRTYTALIESFGRSGNVEESLRLFDEMKRRRIQPSIYIYRSLINNLKKMGKSELAMSYLEEMTTSFADLVGPKDFRRKNR